MSYRESGLCVSAPNGVQWIDELQQQTDGIGIAEMSM
jgi:hypothetical protein